MPALHTQRFTLQNKKAIPVSASIAFLKKFLPEKDYDLKCVFSAVSIKYKLNPGWLDA